MGWAVTAEPDRFEEAEEFFASRVPYTRPQLAGLSEQARNRAWWISGVAQLDIVDQVHQSILRAIRDSEDFDEWKAKIEQQLTDAWGRRDSARLETIFVNATQHAYSAGRYKQLTDPVALEHRPFWQFDAIDDDRISPICEARNGTILPADHPWWTVNHPLLHHRCRSRVRALRPSQVKGKVTDQLPIDPPVTRGFGQVPELDDWEPDLSKVSPKLVAEFQRKTAKKRPEPRVKKHDPPMADRPSLERALDLRDGGAEARGLVRQQIAYSIPRATSKDVADGRGGRGELTTDDARCDAYSAHGFHTWDGRVALRSDVLERARRGAKHVGRTEAFDTASDKDLRAIHDVDGVRLLIHEELHGHSRILPFAYAGPGKILEEASVELLARRALYDVVPAMAKLQPYYVGNWSFGSYREYIDDLRGVVMQAGNLTADAAAESMSRAATAMMGDGSRFHSGEDYLAAWVDELKLDPAAAKQVRSAILAMRA